MSSSVSPASATAAEAGVDGQRQRVDHEPAPDRRPPDAAEHGAVLEALAGHGERGIGRSGAATRSTGSRAPVGSNSGSHTSSSLLETDGDLLADADVGGGAPDDVRRQLHPGVLGQCDVGDDVRRREVGQPTVGVDGEARRPCPVRTLGAGLADRLRQYGQIGIGGCTSSPQSAHF